MTQAVVSRVDAARLEQALLAGIANVRRRRDHINAINVFPVVDRDTGTNLAFTLASVRHAIENRPSGDRLPQLLRTIAEAALAARAHARPGTLIVGLQAWSPPEVRRD